MHHRMAPVLKRVDDQMCEHTWVVAFGACAASGGFSCRDATMQGIDHGFPVDVSMAGCPPRPTAVLEGLLRSQQKVDTADRLDRRTLLRVDGWVYAARRLVYVTPPVNARPHPWSAHTSRRRCTRGRVWTRTRITRWCCARTSAALREHSGPSQRTRTEHAPASSPPMRCDAAATKALAHRCLCESHSAT